MIEPSLSQWRALYAAAVRFRDLAPWQWLEDNDVFGVQDPETGQVGYCVIMGALGEHFALGVYRGTDGLKGLRQQRMGLPPPFVPMTDLLDAQNCLMASFEDREEIEKRDREVMKALGLTFRGRGAWPLFRSYVPGGPPWFVDAGEARFLTLCLEQAHQVSRRLKDNPFLTPDAPPDVMCLVRVSVTSGKRITWRDEFLPPAPIAPRVYESAPLTAQDQETLKILAALPRTNGVLEMEMFTLPAVVQENPEERPRFAVAVIAVPALPSIAPTGKGRRRPVEEERPPIAGADVTNEAQAPEAAVRVLTKTLGTLAMLPASVVVTRADLYAYLKPAAKRLGVRLTLARLTPAATPAKRNLLGMMEQNAIPF